MLVTGGRVFSQGTLIDADILVREGVVEALLPRSGAGGRGGAGEHGADAQPGAFADAPGCQDETLDAAGCVVAPGLVDLHFHGCMGFDLCDANLEGLHAMARYEASRGVTSMCPATMTYPEEVLEGVVRTAAQFAPGPGEARLVGINMEGPFISPHKVGAQNPAYVQRCDAGLVRRLQQASGGLVKLVDVAPEEPGALDFIAQMAGEVRISLAHTCADYECARTAFAAGARQLTHLFNAMPGLHHRDPGPIAAAAEREDVSAELIADGVHVHPSMVRLAFSLFGPERIVLISDSMRACGLGDGVFDLGGQDVQVAGNVAKIEGGALAGSVTDLASCVRTAVVDMGIPLEWALRAACENPARALGLYGTIGTITSGAAADFVLFDEHMEVCGVVARGAKVTAAGEGPAA